MAQQKYVVGFLFDQKGRKVVLIKKTKPEWQKGKLNGVGGKIEGIETPEAAMSREFEEETGLFIDSWIRFVNLQDEFSKQFKVYVFKAFVDQSIIKKVTTTTEEEIGIFNVKDIPMLNCIENTKWLILLALDPNVVDVDIYYQ